MPRFDFPYKLINSPGGVPTNQPSTLTTAGNYIAIVFVAEATISAKKVAFRVGALTGASSTSKITVSIETVDGSNGNPSGTVIASQQVDTDTLTATAWNEITFTTAGTINLGTLYALKINADTGWVTTSLTINYAVSNIAEQFLPYATTGSRINSRHNETFVVTDTSGSPLVYGWPLQTDSAGSLNNSLVEAGNKFKIPTTVCSTYKLIGLRFTGDPGASATPQYKVSVYDWNAGNNSTALDMTVLDPLASASPSGTSVFEVYFDTPPTLTAGNEYIAAVGTNDDTSSTIPIQVRFMAIDDVWKPALWDQTNDYLYDRVTRTSATGSWTVTSNSLCMMHLLIDIASLPSGGGSTSANPLVGYVR